MERLIGIDQAAEILGVKRSTIYQWVSMKKIKHIKVGRLVKFRESDLKEFIEANTSEVDERLN